MVEPFRKILFLFFYLSIVHAQAYKLNVPKVLLPFHSSKLISFTLEAKAESGSSNDDLCFVWSSSRPDIVSINPIYEQNKTTRFNGNECSNRAIVSAVSKHPQRLTSIIFAKEIKTDKLIRCDVIVDQINSIRIKHTTTHLYLEDSPECFTAEALDDEGNTFSSIDGLPFEWTIINDSDKAESASIDSRNVLRISKFIESEYQVSDSIRQLESIGLSGHKILIEGLKTGTANVQAKLIDSFYKDALKTPQVRLLVVANILIEPSYPVYLLVGATIKYNVFLIKQTSVEKINLPSQQYYFETRNNTVANLAQFDSSGSTIQSLNLGSTELVLIDRNMKEELFFIVPPPSTLIHVVQPEYLVFTIKNWHSWILEVGREYEIVINIYSSNRDLIHPSENIRIHAQFEKSKFSILNQSANGSYSLVNALEKGITYAKATLKGAILNGEWKQFGPVIQAEQEIELLDPITVKPKIVIFALSQLGDAGSYEYQLEVSGGSGSYYWQSRNTTIATVNSIGLVRTSATRLGSTSILVTDSRNIDIQSKSTIYVLEPIDLQLLACPVETKQGTQLNLNIKMNAILENGQTHPISDCSRLKFDIFIHNEAIFRFIQVQPSKSPDACAVLVLYALLVGRTHIQINQAHLKSNEIQIGSYSELKSLKNELTLSKDSSFLVNLFDGPLTPSNLETISSSYVSQVEISDKNMVSVESLEHDSHPNRYSYRVKCIKRFDSITQDFVRVKFLISYKKTSANKCPLVFNYDLNVRCTQPQSLELSQLFVNNEENQQAVYSNLKWKCPIKLSSALVLASYERNLNIQLLVKDSFNNIFDNFTALKLDWKIENKKLVEKSTSTQSIQLTAHTNNSLMLHPKGEDVVNSYNFFYQTFSTKSKLGETKVEARLYLDDKYDAENYLASSLTVRLVSDVKIEPETLVLFNHPSNVQTLSLKSGSGYFHAEIDSTDSNVLKINQISENSVQISPLNNNGLAYLNIFDYCIPPHDHIEKLIKKSNERIELKWDSSTSAKIKVAGINSILVNYDDDKLEENSKLKVYVQITDATGNLIQNKYFKLMNLNAKILSQKGENLAHIEQVSQVDQLDSSDRDHTAVYTLTGLKSGLVTIQFEAQSADSDISKQIKSSVQEIQIYKPLKVEPKYIELIQGAEFQIQITGGPSSPDSNIVYELESPDKTIIQIEDKGIINAKEIGKTKVIVKSVGLACLPFTSISTQAEFRCNPENKIRKIYSQDSLQVKVVALNSISLFSPLKSIKIGNEMPIYILANDKTLNPLNFGSSKYLKFEWRINNQQVASLVHPLLEKSLDTEELYDKSFSLRILAKQEGNVKVFVKVEFKNSSLSDSLDIHVFNEAKFTHFKQDLSFVNFVLMTPGTQFQIKTNFDHLSSNLLYELKFFNDSHSIDSFCTKNTIRISATGLIQVDNMRQSQLKYLQECEVGLLIKIESVKQPDLKFQILNYLIKVKPIVYSMIQIDKSAILRSKFKINQKSLIRNRLSFDSAGIQLKCSVSYHDNLGDLFHVVNTRNLFRINRNDLVDYSNINLLEPKDEMINSQENSFSLSIVQPGRFVMELTPSSTVPEDSRDYIGLNILDFKTKDSGLNRLELKIGDLVCLNGEEENQNPPSEWSSQSPNIIRLFSTSGLSLASSFIGVCMESGSTLVKKSSNLDSVLEQTEIRIKPLEKVSFLTLKSKILTNSQSLNQISFQTDSALNPNCSNEFQVLFNSLKQNSDLIPFKCSASIYTQSGKRLEYLDRLISTNLIYTGQHWTCDLNFNASSNSLLYELIENHVENDPSLIQVYVDTKSSEQSIEDQTNFNKMYQATFIPAFYVQNKQIELSVHSGSHFSLVIKATNQLQSHLIITSNLPSLIQIKPIRPDDFSVIYDISTKEDQFDIGEYASVLQQQNGNLYVQIFCSLTEQVERIPFKFAFGYVGSQTARILEVKPKTSKKCLMSYIRNFFSSWIFDYSPNQITSFLIMVSLFLITVLCILKIKSPISQSPEQIATTAAAAAVMATDAYNKQSRVRDYSSFNPYRYFASSTDTTTQVTPRNIRILPPVELGSSGSRTQLNTSGNYARMTPPDQDNIRLFSVDSNVLNSTQYHDANTSINYRSPFRRQYRRSGFDSDND